MFGDAAGYISLVFLAVVLGALGYTGYSLAGYVLVLWCSFILIGLPWIDVVPSSVLLIVYSALCVLLLFLATYAIPIAIESSNRISGLRRLLFSKNMSLEQERRQLVTTVHDVVNPELIVAKMALERLEKYVTRSSISSDERTTILSQMDTVREGILSAYNSGRKIINESRYEILETVGLINAIRHVVASYEKALEGVKFELVVPPGESMLRLDKQVTVNLFSIVRESLLNAVKHANASVIRVSVQKISNLLAIEILDNGRGISNKNSNGIGLLDLNERAAAIGAELTITSGTTVGTKITCSLNMKPSSHVE